ncbi:thymidylate synthase protein [Rhizobium phage RHph_I72]|nr:thymidylate synthase protein [Rhizobium phage RHph_I65]QIG76455.1 thymidylate synthase protein [Rhizobium phage RHph_I72]
MIVVEARNVNDALWRGASILKSQGVQRDSRNGPVLQMPCPVTTAYSNPTERVMLHPGRDANPFFHLVEALWMIAGRNDLATLTPYVKNMVNFSDDGGKTQPGAYGHRWRKHFLRPGLGNSWIDQLPWAIRRLKDDPNDRRVVIQMYDAEVDQDAADDGGKDIPCNLIALPTINIYGALDLTVFNRSNDMVWGAYGANAVHFSVLQEVVAAAVGVPVGYYYQVSNNFHGYLATLGKAGDDWPWGFAGPADEVWGSPNPDPYEAGTIRPFPIWSDGLDTRLNLQSLTEDIIMFLEDPARVGIRSAFLRKIACPMVMAHRAAKAKDYEASEEILQQMPHNNDWRAGAELWIKNRKTPKEG